MRRRFAFSGAAAPRRTRPSRPSDRDRPALLAAACLRGSSFPASSVRHRLGVVADEASGHSPRHSRRTTATERENNRDGRESSRTGSNVLPHRSSLRPAALLPSPRSERTGKRGSSGGDGRRYAADGPSSTEVRTPIRPMRTPYRIGPHHHMKNPTGRRVCCRLPDRDIFRPRDVIEFSHPRSLRIDRRSSRGAYATRHRGGGQATSRADMGVRNIPGKA